MVGVALNRSKDVRRFVGDWEASRVARPGRATQAHSLPICLQFLKGVTERTKLFLLLNFAQFFASGKKNKNYPLKNIDDLKTRQSIRKNFFCAKSPLTHSQLKFTFLGQALRKFILGVLRNLNYYMTVQTSSQKTKSAPLD